jgi:hypothetical protein
MSLHNLFIVILFSVLLFATAASAQRWSDIVMSIYINVTNSTVKMCAVDLPSRCVFVPKLNRTIAMTPDEFVNKTVSLIYHERGSLYYYPPDFELLQHVAWVISNVQSYTVRVPAPGILYSPNSFRVNNRTAGPQPAICGMNIQHGYVVSAGTYVVTGLSERLLWLDPSTCISYRLVDFISRAPNVTGKAYIFIFYMPTARLRYQMFRENQWTWGFNGTAHAYFLSRDFMQYITTGMYVANATRLPAAVVSTGGSGGPPPLSYGPVHYGAYRNATNFRSLYAMLTIGADPGDGIIPVRFPTLRGRVEVAYVADGTAGYVQLPGALDGVLMIYAQRYALAEVVVTNKTYVYAMRLFACPAYQGQSAMTDAARLFLPPRLDRAHEVEICNNNTRTLYVGVYVTSPFTGYAWLDELKPGDCRRLRWDGIYGAVRYHFYNSTYNICRRATEFIIDGAACPAGWRCHLFGRTLTAVRPIDIDAFYAMAWLNLTRYLAQLYNATVNTLLQWLQQQANASRSLSDFLRSQPHHVGTIRIESSTSVWLRTTLHELQRWQVAGPPPSAGGGVSVSPLAPSALTATVAAAAVATAWAASRRSLATAAFLAGFAILASSLFVYYLYDMTVASAIILAAVLLMSIGAAAAWFRKSED